jgi:hypothetical protein
VPPAPIYCTTGDPHNTGNRKSPEASVKVRSKVNSNINRDGVIDNSEIRNCEDYKW